MDSLVDAFDRAAIHAARAGLADSLLGMRAYGRSEGATPVSEVLAWLDQQSERDQRGWPFRGARMHATAMAGRLGEAREQLRNLREELAERGPCVALAATCGIGGPLVELLAGDPAKAAALGEEGCRLFDELGQTGLLSSAAAILAEAYYQLGRLDEADAWVARARDLGAGDDVFTQLLWRLARAKVCARRGAHDDAKRLAREAIAISERTDMIDDQAAAYADLAEVLQLGGSDREAADALREALARFERKENVVMARRVRARLEALLEPATA
jgi:tetratricopeptide (TPR) repeat protein